MGNAPSMATGFPGSSGAAAKACTRDTTTTSSSSKKQKGGKTSGAATTESATDRAKKVLGDVQESLKIGVKKLEDQDHPAAHLIDTVCGPYFDSQGHSNHRNRKMRENRSASFYSEDYNSDDSRTISEDEQTLDTDYNPSTVNGSTIASSAVGPTKKAVSYTHLTLPTTPYV